MSNVTSTSRRAKYLSGSALISASMRDPYSSGVSGCPLTRSPLAASAVFFGVPSRLMHRAPFASSTIGNPSASTSGTFAFGCNAGLRMTSYTHTGSSPVAWYTHPAYARSWMLNFRRSQ